ncbi:MAG TPA: LptF/LptG family permease [Treponemataceae bacterium]|nr:LptF/LptG family permease [Treponemataceae bacterium]
MKLYNYLLRRFMPVFLGAMFFFSFLLVLIDLLINISNYLNHQVAVSTVAKICLLYIPQTIAWAVPLSMLFAVAFTLSMLYAKSELTVIFASGVSLFKFTLPLLVFSFLVSISFFHFQDKIVIPYYGQKVDLQNTVLNKIQSYDNSRVVIQADGGRIVYKADSYNDKKKRLSRLYIVLRNDDASLNQIVYAPSAEWKEDRWFFSNPTTYLADGDDIVIQEKTNFISFESPETFQNVTVNVTEVTAKEARKYVDKLLRTGLPYTEALSQYYAKYSFPFVIFIVVFFSIGLTGKSRKNVLLVSIIMCVSSTVIFYVLQMVFMWLARFGYVSPLVGAWFSVIFFVFLSIGLLFFART